MSQPIRPDEKTLLFVFACAQRSGTLFIPEGMHPKRVRYITEKWARKGWLSDGVTLTEAGLEAAGKVSSGT